MEETWLYALEASDMFDAGSEVERRRKRGGGAACKTCTEMSVCHFPPAGHDPPRSSISCPVKLAL